MLQFFIENRKAKIRTKDAPKEGEKIRLFCQNSLQQQQLIHPLFVAIKLSLTENTYQI